MSVYGKVIADIVRTSVYSKITVFDDEGIFECGCLQMGAGFILYNKLTMLTYPDETIMKDVIIGKEVVTIVDAVINPRARLFLWGREICNTCSCVDHVYDVCGAYCGGQSLIWECHYRK